MKTIQQFALFLFTSPFLARAADEFEGYIRQLAVDLPERDAVRAERALSDAGLRAFPALLAHLTDDSPTHSNLRRRAVLKPGPGAVNDSPTVGELCFDILQTQIEGNWPKAFHQFYILTPANAKQWLEDRQSLSLQQLQTAAREESLRRARSASSKNPSDSGTQAVAFLEKEVAKLRQAK